MPCALGQRNSRVARSLPGGALPTSATSDTFWKEPRSVPVAQREPVASSPAGARLPGAGRCSRCARSPASGSARKGTVITRSACSSGARCEFNGGGRAGGRGAGAAGSPGGAGRGVSARSLTAGIWGVIERGGRPGARVGLHEQLNVIRPRPSGSSCVIDNPAAFLPGPRLQTGGRRRAGPGAERGDPALPGPALPFSPRRPRPRGETRGPALSLLRGPPGWPARCSGEGRRPRDAVARSPPRQGAAPGGASRAGLRNPARNRWNRGRKTGNRDGVGGGEEVTVGTRINRKPNTIQRRKGRAK